jgi:urease accessory protein
MKLKYYAISGVAAAGVAASQSAQAHALGAHGAGFAAGFVHPFLGADHVLAMLAVGMWAVRQGGRALWGVPLAFVGTAAVGASLGAAGLSLPLVEAAIAASVMVLGLLIAASVRLNPAWGMALAGLFALFHGHAHGAEMPAVASSGLYLLGFLLATCLLHGAGLVAGVVLRSRDGMLRLGGAAMAGAGIWMLVA